jgi:hypothetical protein
MLALLVAAEVGAGIALSFAGSTGVTLCVEFAYL